MRRQPISRASSMTALPHEDQRLGLFDDFADFARWDVALAERAEQLGRVFGSHGEEQPARSLGVKEQRPDFLWDAIREFDATRDELDELDVPLEPAGDESGARVLGRFG